MKKSKFDFILGFLIIQIGACWIHKGLGLIILGVYFMVCSYIEFEEENDEGNQMEE